MENSPKDLQLDALFGMVESMSVMISALIAHHPDRDGLEAHVDFRIPSVRAAIVGASRTDATLEAFDDMNSAFKAVFNDPFVGWDDSHKVFQDLSTKLSHPKK